MGNIIYYTLIFKMFYLIYFIIFRYFHSNHAKIHYNKGALIIVPRYKQNIYNVSIKVSYIN